jgi:glycosyltransferase involved in cell wall biosynthesis
MRSKMRQEVWLLNTSRAGSQGSMARYANDVAAAIELADVNEQWVVRKVAVDDGKTAPALEHTRFSTWIRHMRLRLAVSKLRPPRDAIIHILDGSYSYLAAAFPGRKRVITAHDLIPMRQMEHELGEIKVSRPAKWLINRSLAQIRCADCVIAVSHSTQEDLIALAKLPSENIHVAHNAVALNKQHNDSKPCPPEILHVGNNAFYKNRPGVLRIFQHIRRSEDVVLRVVGPLPSSATREWLEKSGLSPFVKFESDLEENELVQAYQTASLFLFPSLYEGFGWPPLEAMANGCPVVCSSEGSLPEVGGDAALMAPAIEETLLADHCIRLLQDEDLRAACIRRGYEQASRFSLQTMGEKLLVAYEQAAAG